MPRLSLYRKEKGNEYRYFDKLMSERFTTGGTTIYIHKYLGPADTGPSEDATQPQHTNQSERNIQDLLFGENRDRKYDSDIYSMRGLYQRVDQDFDLSQFGIFLATGTLFMTFHLNDMVQTLGRKIMAGDVFELEHLVDEHALNNDLPAALKRYYVVSDASWPAEGFSATWYPHLWRTKINPLVDSQEYKDILNKIAGTGPTGNSIPVADIVSTYQTYLDINHAIVDQAESDVPKSGYDTEHLWTAPTDFDEGSTPVISKYESYLTGDGLAPNGFPVTSGVAFPDANLVALGDYHLRLDFSPPRLFRYTGKRWVKVEDVQRTNISRGPENMTQRSTFVNNTNTLTDINDNVMEERTSLHDALKARPD